MWLEPAPSFRSPEDVARRLARSEELAWLDGGLEHGREGRFSFVAAAPVQVCEAFPEHPAPLAVLRRLRPAKVSVRPAPDDEASPLTRHDVPLWIGHIAYDAHPFAPAKTRQRRARDLPLLRFCRYDAVYAFDHQTQRAWLAGDDAHACARLARRLEQAPLGADDLPFQVGAVTATAREAHVAAIERALEHIRSGDVYEINLARCFGAAFQGSPLGLFLEMRRTSAVPLGYFAQTTTHALLGRSMERFLRYRSADRALWTSPIKGTIARAGGDAAAAASLRGDPKEQAEHAMVVDLMRNDLGRICEIGSVEIEELMAVLPFAGLSHLVSTLRGTLRPEHDLPQILTHTFPPGSVTGAPKERTLELIEALEPSARGFYTGAVGFVDRAGGLSLAVSIRTAVVHRETVAYFAGGGIVIDSDPWRETLETELKAQSFLAAIARGQAGG